MKTFLRSLTIILFLTVLIPARAIDTADLFLKAYFLIQDGDAAEKGDDRAKASEKYGEAYKMLRQIQKNDAEWNPNIIAYRTKYAGEHIVKNGGKIPTDEEIAAASAPQPSEAPAAPSPTPAPTADSTPAPAAPTPTPTSEQPTKLAETPQPSAPVAAGDSVSASRIAALERELEDTRVELKKIQQEKTDLESRLKKAEDDLKLAGSGGDERVQALLQENNKLKQNLSDAEARLKGLPSSSGDIGSLRVELEQAQKALENLKKENEDLRASNDSLKRDLEETRTQLKMASSGGTVPLSPEALQTLQKENALLRSIVERHFQEDSRRAAARDILTAELKELGTRTESIRAQLEVLKTPLSPLSDDERSLLKISSGTSIRTTSEDPSKLSGVVTNTKRGTPEATKLSGDNAILASDAKRLFSKGDLNGAAAKYEMIVKNDPKNIFALSNLGVIRFRQDRIVEAEKSLRQALALDPQDAFSLSVLGIVHYKNNKFDEAISTLTRAISINPNNPETHNYLGITYSQKGYQEAAEKELMKALEIQPDYPDAHFNLAVVLTSQTPPSTELAKKHYKKAVELGIAKDAEFEKLLNKS